MDKQTFTFGDYLNQLATNATGDNAEKILIEVEHIKSHCANLPTMQKHLKQYKTLKSLFDNGIDIFSPSKQAQNNA